MTADDLPRLYELAAEGMMSILGGGETVRNRRKKRIRVEAANLEELMLTWLREILWTFERKRMIFNNFQIEKNNFSETDNAPFFLEAVVSGERYTPARHGICKEIKAVTRHGLAIRKMSAGWKASILFDI